MRHATFAFIIIIIFTSTLHAQRIRVLNATGKEPIENVAIFNISREKAVITDTLGYTHIDVFRGEDSIVFQHPSYDPKIYSWLDLSEMNYVFLSRKNILIDEFVISATKSRESKQFVPYMIDVLEQEALSKSVSLSAADILEANGNILIQKTQGGGGSPILRGFEANKILLVVDGVRMNNAIYRNGHLQNSITIDQSILDRVEVIFGPTSLIYGSDALGGVIHYYTRDPELSKDTVAYTNLRAYSQFHSANRGAIGHIDFSIGKAKFGSLSSVTYKKLGDLRIGSNRPPYYNQWGKILHFVNDVGGADSTVENKNALIQKNSGYGQIDFLQKFRYSPSQYVDWILNLQYSTSSDISRIDKLNDYSGENLKYAEYYYGPQTRLMASLKNVYKRDNILFTNITSILAFQKIDEDRYSRKFRNPEKLVQLEDVNVYSLNVDMLKILNSENKLNYGLDVNHNTVFSDAYYTHIQTDEKTAAQTRYPEKGSYIWSVSAYGHYKWIYRPNLIFSGGLRYSWSGLHSQFDNTLLPYERIKISNGAITGSVSMIYHPTMEWQINAIASTGFRNPNVDDYGKVRAKDDYIMVPNDQIKPEYTYNLELGISRVIEGYIKFDLVGYYTFLRDAIVRTFYQLEGRDSLLYDGDYYKITANYNAGKGWIYGLSANLTAHINETLFVKGTFNYTKGWNTSDDVPLGHIPPIFGRSSITYEKKKFSFITYVVYQGWKNIDEFSPYGEDNNGEATRYGYPGWWTLNIKTSYQPMPALRFMLSFENILDTFYKPYASGLSGPGRNIVVSAHLDL